jgi:hypothetical protein
MQDKEDILSQLLEHMNVGANKDCEKFPHHVHKKSKSKISCEDCGQKYLSCLKNGVDSNLIKHQSTAKHVNAIEEKKLFEEFKKERKLKAKVKKTDAPDLE